MSSEGKHKIESTDTIEDVVLNCWESRNCGREVNGAKADVDGVCPAAEAITLDGINRGINAGRICWVVAGTMGSKECNLTFSEKIVDCVMCDFYQTVLDQEQDFEIFPSKY
ncbi:MAG: two-CW domain-containing protein [Candidatus Thorarchaeota archaeon]